jgi:hypothetical protein
VGVTGVKTVWTLSGVLALSFVLGGCASSGFLNSMGLGNSPAPQQTPVVRTGNNLALPPDLQLRPPGTVAENYQPTSASRAGKLPLEEDMYSSPPVPGSGQAGHLCRIWHLKLKPITAKTDELKQN